MLRGHIHVLTETWQSEVKALSSGNSDPGISTTNTWVVPRQGFVACPFMDFVNFRIEVSGPNHCIPCLAHCTGDTFPFLALLSSQHPCCGQQPSGPLPWLSLGQPRASMAFPGQCFPDGRTEGRGLSSKKAFCRRQDWAGRWCGPCPVFSTCPFCTACTG